jgi:hypothetical protein
MSSSIWKYFITSSTEQQEAMGVSIEKALQDYFKDRLLANPTMKLDDFGDALLHSLNSILCGSTTYQQLLPRSPLMHNNRTIVITVLPDRCYYVTFESKWNKILLQDLGHFSMDLSQLTYRDEETVDKIAEILKLNLLEQLTKWNVTGTTIADTHSTTNTISILIKQLKGAANGNLDGPEAGALTNSTVDAFEKIIDEAVPNSVLCSRNTKSEGYVYRRTCERSGRKCQLRRSTGKHTNSMLTCLTWMKTNTPEFVKNRPLRMNKAGRAKFFKAMRGKAKETNTEDRRIEKLHFSDNIQNSLELMPHITNRDALIFGDLMLIGINDNQQFISAIAENYRNQVTRNSTKKNKARKQTDKQYGPFQRHICLCTTIRNVDCKSIKHFKLSCVRIPFNIADFNIPI